MDKNTNKNPQRSKPQLESTYDDKILIQGYLKKKSHNKIMKKISMQERFVKIQGCCLIYYKKEGDDNELGSIDLSSAEYVRPVDRGAECVLFELSTRGSNESKSRLYVFQTESNADLRKWLGVMTGVREGTRDIKESEQKNKILAETPLRFRIYHEKGFLAFGKYINDEVKLLYCRMLKSAAVSASNGSEGSSNSKDMDDCVEDVILDDNDSDLNEFKLSHHISAARAVHVYLEDFVLEFRKKPSAQTISPSNMSSVVALPRYDILGIFMTEVNNVLAYYLLPVISSESREIAESSLFDLHNAIDWLTKYQSALKKCYCPVPVPPPPANASPNGLVDATDNEAYFKALSPYVNPIFDCIPSLCYRYVNGSSDGSLEGATTHLVDHCLKVWNSFINSPEEMLQRHLDNSFYTHAPTDMWESMHQHLSLATSTKSAVLHVMIVDKIVNALSHISYVVDDYISNLDALAASSPNNRESITNKNGLQNTTGATGNAEWKEIELELLCALANDMALHIEQIIKVVESIEIPEIRAKIDELFDSATMSLVKSGQTCLKRLSRILCLDIDEQLNQVMTEQWLEGNQVKVITATLTDYLNDLELYLMPFWCDKFIYILLEAVILKYTRAVILNGNSNSTASGIKKLTDLTKEKSKVAINKVSSFFGMKPVFNGTSASSTDSLSSSPTSAIKLFLQPPRSVGNYCMANADSLGRIAQDVNIFNQFFHSRVGQETATEFLGIINEASLMFFLTMEELEVHVMSRIAVYPSSAVAIFEMTMYCARMRQDFDEADVLSLQQALQPALRAAPRAAEENTRLCIPEGRLGLLYADLIAECPVDTTMMHQPTASSPSSGAVTALNSRFPHQLPVTKNSLAQKLKDMANIPLAALKKAIEIEQDSDVSDDDDDEGWGDLGESSDDDDCSSEVNGWITKDQQDGSTNKDVKPLRNPEDQRALMLIQRRSQALRKETVGLVDEVLDVIRDQDSDLLSLVSSQVQQLQEEETKQAMQQVVSLESYLDKKSPAHNLWQNRYFKILTRDNPAYDADLEDDGINQISNQIFIYCLLWYKKKGGAVLKSLMTHTITSLAVLQSSRALVCDIKSGKLKPESELTSVEEELGVVPVQTTTGTGGLGAEIFVFSLSVTDGKEHVLRTGKVDKLVVWINSLALVTGLSYDSIKGIWTRGGCRTAAISPVDIPVPVAAASSPKNNYQNEISDVRTTALEKLFGPTDDKSEINSVYSPIESADQNTTFHTSTATVVPPDTDPNLSLVASERRQQSLQEQPQSAPQSSSDTTRELSNISNNNVNHSKNQSVANKNPFDDNNSSIYQTNGSSVYEDKNTEVLQPLTDEINHSTSSHLEETEENEEAVKVTVNPLRNPKKLSGNQLISSNITTGTTDASRPPNGIYTSKVLTTNNPLTSRTRSSSNATNPPHISNAPVSTSSAHTHVSAANSHVPLPAVIRVDPVVSSAVNSSDDEGVSNPLLNPASAPVKPPVLSLQFPAKLSLMQPVTQQPSTEDISNFDDISNLDDNDIGVCRKVVSFSNQLETRYSSTVDQDTPNSSTSTPITAVPSKSTVNNSDSASRPPLSVPPQVLPRPILKHNEVVPDVSRESQIYANDNIYACNDIASLQKLQEDSSPKSTLLEKKPNKCCILC